MSDLKKLVRKNILTLEPYSSARAEFNSPKGILLDANENPFGTWNRYPDPCQIVLKQKLAEQNEVNTENILIGNGSDELIDLIIRIFCTPGRDKVLSCSPTYGMYKVAAAINDIEMLDVPLTKDFQLNKNPLLNALQDSDLKVVFLCSPNNPTGNCIDDVDLVCNNFEGIVVLDEAYIDFAERPSMLAKLAEYPRLVILQTLSKAWGLAGARIGVAYADAELISYCNKTKPPYNVSALNQAAAIKALEDIAGYKKQKALLLAQRTKLKAAIETMPMIVKVYPSDANFLLIQTHDANSLYQSLLVKDIIVRNRSHEIADCIRISIGTPEENQALLRALNDIQSSCKTEL